MRSVLGRLICTLLIGRACAVAHASPTDESLAPGYRRIHVPADRPELWPTDGHAMVPVEREEVLRLLRPAFSGQPAAAVARSQWWAELRPEGLVGEGRLELRRGEQREAFVPWRNTKIRVEQARWQSDQQLVLLGQWGQSDPPTHGLLVDRNGAIRFRFVALAEQSTGEQSTYLIESPPALVAELVIDLPEGLRLAIDQGIVQRGDREQAGGLAPSAPPPGWARWRVLPVPGNAWRLSIERPTSPRLADSSLLSYAQDITCRVSESGVSTVCRMRIRSNQPLPPAVQILLDPRSRVLGVQQDGLPVEWSLSRDAQQRPQVRAELRGGVDQQTASLEINLLAPPREERDTSLPFPTLVDSRWLEGVLRLRVEPPLRLLDLPLANGCLLTGLPPSPAQPGVQEFEFRSSRASPELLVTAGPDPLRLSARIERRVLLGQSQTRSRVRITLANDQSLPAQTMLLPIQPGWKVDGVESSPAVLLESWSEERDAPAQPRRLSLVLRPVQVDEEAALTVSLSRASGAPPSRTPLGQLEGVVCSALRVLSDELALSAEPPLRAVLKSAPPAESEGMVTSDNEALLFSLQDTPFQEALAGAAAALTARKPELVETCRVRVELSEAAWLYRAEIPLPSGGLPSQTHLRFAPPLPATASVILGSAAPQPASLFRFERGGEKAEEGAAIEQIRLPHSGVDAQQCVVIFDSPADSRLAPPLPWIASRPGQQARISLKGSGIELSQTGLESIGRTGDAPPLDDTKSFLYAPSEVGSPGLSVVLSRRPSSTATSNATLLLLETRLLSSGATRHVAEFAVTPSATRLPLELPAGAAPLSATDEQGRPIALASDGDGQVVLNPAAMDRTQRVQLVYEDLIGDWRDAEKLTASPPRGARLGVWSWRVVAPEHYSLRGALVGAERVNWRERLFGPLSSVRADSPVNPFSQESWRRAMKRAWRLSGLAASDPLEAPTSAVTPFGWRSFEFSLAGPSPVSVQVYDHRQRIGAAAAFSVLLMLSAALLWPVAPRGGTALTLVAGAAALLLPASLALWGAAAWIGLLAGALLCWLWRAWPRGHRVSTPTKHDAQSTVTLLVLFALAGAAQGQTAATSPIEPILIPVDEAGAPVGDKWYLSSSFLQRVTQTELRERFAAPADWVLQSQQLSGAFQEQSPSNGFAPGKWSLRWELATLRRQVRLRLPLRRSDAEWSPKALVDGIAKPLAWSSDGDGCVLQIDEPGVHQVVLELTPVVLSEESRSCVQLGLLSCPRSTLSLRAPSGLSELTSPATALLAAVDGEGLRLEADLGGSDEAVLCWAASEPGQPRVKPSCELLQWMSVTDSGAAVRCRFVVEGAAPLPRELSIRIPADWSPVVGESAQGKVELAPDQPWSEDLGQLTYTAQFELRRTAGLGVITIPPVRPAGADLRARLLAVSCSPQVKVTPQPTTDAALVEPDEFFVRWGAAPVAESVQAVVLATDLNLGWGLQVDPQLVKPFVADQSLTLVLGRRSTSCHYQAVIEPSQWPVGVLQLQTADSFRLLSVSVTQGDSKLSVRTAQPAPDRLSVFLPPEASLGGEFRLDLYGNAAPATNEPQPAPLVRLDPAGSAPLRLLIRRRSDLLVKLAEQVAEAPQSITGPTTLPGYEVATLRLTEGSSAPRLTAQPNRSAYNATTASLHSPVDGGLSQQAAVLVSAVSGEVDRLFFRTAEPRRAPRLVAPENAALSPCAEFGAGCWRVALESPLRQGQQTLLQLAFDNPRKQPPLQAVLLGMTDARRQTSLVAIASNEALQGQWRTRGMTFAHDQPPAELAALGTGDVQWFRVPTPTRAVLQWESDQSPAPELSVVLRDTVMQVDDSGAAALRTRFFLQPDGAAECGLWLPNGLELAMLKLNGAAPLVSQITPHLLRVTLLDRSSPQMLTVVVTAAEHDVRLGVRPPWLAGVDGQRLAPEQDLLSVRHPEYYLAHLTAPAVEVPAVEREALLVRLLTTMASMQKQPLDPWWASRLGDAVHLAGQDQSGGGGATTGLSPVDDRTAAEAVLPDAPGYEPDEALALLSPAADRPLRVFRAETLEPLEVRVTRQTPAGWTSRLALAVLLAVAGLIGLRPEGAHLREWIAHHRHPAWAAIGLVWWLWLPFGFCGLVLMAVAAVAELRDRRALLSLTGWTA